MSRDQSKKDNLLLVSIQRRTEEASHLCRPIKQRGKISNKSMYSQPCIIHPKKTLTLRIIPYHSGNYFQWKIRNQKFKTLISLLILTSIPCKIQIHSKKFKNHKISSIKKTFQPSQLLQWPQMHQALWMDQTVAASPRARLQRILMTNMTTSLECCVQLNRTRAAFLDE